MSPFKKSALIANVFLKGGGALSFSFFLSSFLVRLKLGSGLHTGHGWSVAFSEGMYCCFCAWVPPFRSKFVVFCFGRLKSALRFCGQLAWFFLRFRSAVVRSFLGFGARLAGGSSFSSLSLSLSFSFLSLSLSFIVCFCWVLVRPHFF